MERIRRRDECREAAGAIYVDQCASSLSHAAISTDMAETLRISRVSPRSLHSDDEVDSWVKRMRNNPTLRTMVVPLNRLEGWEIDSAFGNIVHSSGRFFSIVGARARHRSDAGELEWDQPIIDQPEIGILGILAKRIDGVLHFCLQAKEEPGNINSVQLSPTVQATYSNYTRVHGGKLPAFVPFFLDPPKEKVLFAKLQTEDGGRFLFKSNRNMIVFVGEDELQELPEGFLWLTLGQIGRLLRFENLVNACCRSVLAGLFSGPDLCGGAGAAAPGPDPCGSWADYADLVQWIDDRKTSNHILQKRIPLNQLAEWHWTADGHLAHRKGRYFAIKGLSVTAASRETRSWCQPILDNVATGIIGLLVRQGERGTEYLMQAKAEIGHRSIIQVGPTVQFTQENYLDDQAARRPFLFEEFQDPHGFIPVAESRQSEEGARFFREEHVHRILRLQPHRSLDLPPGYRWLTADQIRFLVHCGEQVNSCARSILACLV